MYPKKHSKLFPDRDWKGDCTKKKLPPVDTYKIILFFTDGKDEY